MTSDRTELWSIDTGWACAGVFVRNGIIIGGAPIFRKLIGKPIAGLPKHYKVESCEPKGGAS